MTINSDSDSVLFRQIVNPSLNKVIKLNEVKQITTLSTASIYRQIKDKSFPKQIKLGERSSAWFYDEIIQWLEDKRIERDGESK
ncbi:AlpA family phage regulatory protein [Candidatus Pseudothioglobus singularis]|nr:AlpA family phage regulatory protein [Candidatus Pseudothioglobus singularis]